MTDENIPWLGAGEVLLHIGVHKTGTTAVQGALAAARPRLEAQGVRYAAKTISHYHAAMAAIGKRRGWELGGGVPKSGRWERLVKEVARATVPIVISSEAFCEASDDAARTIVDSLGGERVKVLVTLRPLENLIPSSWQEYVKGGLATTYDDWLADTMRGPGSSRLITPSFWKRNDHAAVVERWARVVGADRLTVIVVDTREKDSLFRTFESIIGLETGTLVADESVPSNRSLSLQEVELIRSLNADIAQSVPYGVYNRLVRQGGIKSLVEGRRPDASEGVLSTPAWARATSREFGASAVERIAASGVHVRGDLALLVPDGPIDPAGDPQASPAVAVPVQAATLMLRGMLDRSMQNADAIAEMTRELAADTAADAPASTAGGGSGSARGAGATQAPGVVSRVKRTLSRVRRRLSR